MTRDTLAGLGWWLVLLLPLESRQFLQSGGIGGLWQLLSLMVSSVVAGQVVSRIKVSHRLQRLLLWSLVLPMIGAFSHGVITGLMAWAEGTILIAIKSGSILKTGSWALLGSTMVPWSVYSAFVMLYLVSWYAVPAGVFHAALIMWTNRLKAERKSVDPYKCKADSSQLPD